jgi:2'-5' RNA ligase
MADRLLSPIPRQESHESALIVPVPEAEHSVKDLRVRYDPAALAGIPAHITVLYPFVAPEALNQSILTELAAIFTGVAPFPFTLGSIARFPDVAYLAPHPAEPFSRLTAAIATRWPETPPYGGVYDRVIPHLTVAHTADTSTVADIRRKIEPALPISCVARQAWLLTNRGELWAVDQRFPFGGRAHR